MRITELQDIRLQLEDEMFELQRSFEVQAKHDEELAREKYESLNALYDDAFTSLSCSKAELVTLKGSFSATEADLISRITQLEVAVSHESERYKNLMLLMDEREAQKAEISSTLSKLQEEAARDKRDLQQLRLTYAATKDTVAVLEEELSRQTDLSTAQKESLETHVQEIVRLEITRQRQEAIIRDSEVEVLSLRDRNAVLETKLSSFESTDVYRKQIETLSEDLRARDEDYEALNNVHVRMKTRLDDLEKFVAEKTTEVRELQAQNRELFRKLSSEAKYASPAPSPSAAALLEGT